MNSGGINETLGVGGATGRSGANLMGADLYKHLKDYFVAHLRGVREVRPVSFHLLPTRFLSRRLTHLTIHRRPPTCRTSRSCATTRASGTATRPAPAT